MPLTDKLRAALGEDAEKYSSLLDEADEEYKSLGSKFSKSEEQLKDVKTESAERRRAIRDEYKPKIETLEDEAVKLKSQIDGFDDSESKTTIETLKTENDRLMGFAKTKFKGDILTISKDGKFSKVSTVKFTNLPLDDDGKLIEDKLDEMSNEDILTNQNALSDLRQIGYFEEDVPGTPPPGFPGGGNPNPLADLQAEFRAEKDPRKRDLISQKISAAARK